MVLREFSRFTGDTVGLEKLLRLIQGLMQLLIANPFNSPIISTYTWAPIALKQCAVTRRAFRYFRFIDFSYIAAEKFNGLLMYAERKRAGTWGDGVVEFLEAMRALFMMGYLGLEACTILHAIGILTSPWGAEIFFSAMQMWFYAISCSVILLSYQLLLLRDDERKSPKPVKAEDEKSEKNDKTSPEPSPKLPKKESETPRSVLFSQLIGATCDLLIPGSFVGWLDVSPAVVAETSILSSVLSSIEIWKRVNRV